MIDQSKINLLDVIGTNTLQKTTLSNGGEYHGQCPFCGGKDRFWVVPEKGRWYCRHCTPKGGDAISFVRMRDNCDFKTAMSTLGLSSGPRPSAFERIVKKQSTPYRMQDSDPKAILSEESQKAAYEFHMRSFDYLRENPQAKGVWDYLTLGRRISESALNAFLIGYNPHKVNARWGDVDVYLPQGIVIPWVDDGIYLNLRFRLGKNAKNKYIGVAESLNGLFGNPSFDILTEPGCLVLLVEGEFDGMAFLSASQRKDIIILATGSTSGGRTFRARSALSRAAKIAVAFDKDEAGEKAATWWLGRVELAGKTFRLTPSEHDVNDMTIKGHDVDAWVEPIFGPSIPAETPTKPVVILEPAKIGSPIEATIPPLQAEQPLESILPLAHVGIDLNRKNELLARLEMLEARQAKRFAQLDALQAEAQRILATDNPYAGTKLTILARGQNVAYDGGGLKEILANIEKERNFARVVNRADHIHRELKAMAAATESEAA